MSNHGVFDVRYTGRHQLHNEFIVLVQEVSDMYIYDEDGICLRTLLLKLEM